MQEQSHAIAAMDMQRYVVLDLEYTLAGIFAK